MEMRGKIRLAWGKLRRIALISFFRGAVNQNIDRRRGTCNRSGVCCKLLLRCPAYDDSTGSPRCLAYNDRPGVCSLFPIDERDIRDRDLMSPETKCGFTFIEKRLGSGNGNGNGRHRMPWEKQVGPMGLYMLARTLAVLRTGSRVKRADRPVALKNGNGHAGTNG
ncbi:MAG: hypothetical protein A2Z34_03295 [Planctomycetes bacterium RBG_16_59_8]|nr:MAG: hypothetical protein A2Z34_03295 [Planctomycetes bacterium RBG_16_59_8]